MVGTTFKRSLMQNKSSKNNVSVQIAVPKEMHLNKYKLMIKKIIHIDL